METKTPAPQQTQYATLKYKVYTFIKWSYYFLLFIALMNGISKGLDKWYKYRYEVVNLGNPEVQSIVNICVSVAYLLVFVGSSSILSFIIASTAPISVPLIIFFARKTVVSQLNADISDDDNDDEMDD